MGKSEHFKPRYRMNKNPLSKISDAREAIQPRLQRLHEWGLLAFVGLILVIIFLKVVLF